MADLEQLRILRQGVRFWNEWRETNPSIKPDLQGADLRGMDLRHANLAGTDLSGAVLSGIGLSGAILTQATLVRTSLHSADLLETNLSSADLTKTDLSKAYLMHTDFTGAKLTETVFSESRVLDCRFGDVDLSEAIGLDTIRHWGASTIGTDTIYKSQWRIPEVFLRGAGVQEEFVQLISSLASKPIDYFSCFISHSSKEKAFARQLYNDLQRRGIRCWLDEKHLLPGEDLYEGIDRGISKWDKVLLCCSENALSSWWVDDEIARAFKKEQELMRERGKKVLALIPLNLDGFMFGGRWDSGKATEIKTRVAADFTGWDKDNARYEAELERVVRALRTDGGREEPPKQKL